MTTERTERQKEAARANGAKSRGPVTAEGKARSSTNATTHGLTAATVLLPGESEEQFHALLESMLEDYAPSTDYEVSLVEKMAALNWQQDRLLGIDTVTLGVQMEVMAPALEAELEHLSTPARIALAYRDLSDHSRVLSNLDRHASRIRRQFTQLRTELLALQKGRKSPETEPKPLGPEVFPADPNLQNEPKAQTPSDSDSCLVASDSYRKLQNEPTAPTRSNSDSGLPTSDFSQKLQNEPNAEQLFTHEPHTNSQTELGALATGRPNDAPATDQARSNSDSSVMV